MPNWSPQQEAIFEWFRAAARRNLVVRARAGTGKTTTIIEGIARAPEDKILLAAFNKRIAVELQAKMRTGNAEAKTLHALGYKFVLRNWTNCRLDEKRGWRLAVATDPTAPDDMVKLIQQIAAAAKGCCPLGTVEQVAAMAEEQDLLADEEWEEEGWTSLRLATLAKKAMAAACMRDGTIDYDDMVFVPVANKWVRPWFDMVVIDEAQDMNACQILMAQRCARGRVVVVGDDRQAIYGFRGADSGSLDRLKAELKADELGLTVTYRCPKTVVERAQQYVPDFVAASTAPTGTVTTSTVEAMNTLAVPGDFILSRANAPLVGICLGFLRAGKRARVEGKDVGAGLVALVKKLRPRSIPDFLSRLTRHEAQQEKRIRKSAKAGDDDRVERRISDMLDKTDTLRALAEGMAGIPELTARIEDLFCDVAAKGGQIVCSSVHKAKGLEADRVFILSDTLRDKPVEKNGVVRQPQQEELNIAYVAVTRAKRDLVMVPGVK